MTTTSLKEALEHLASIDPIELCNEAKIERCRATRDLSSCGRYVHHVLNSCGHASLCAECNQRCDTCPICRTSIPNGGTRIRLRLYYKCIEAGLVSKRHDERFHDKDDSGGHVMADIQRLYSLFDVALENNLVSLICHYITDVCMDENAVSSDPVLAFLLDEVVVKDWCKQTLDKIICDLREKYCLGAEDMKANLCSFQKSVSKLVGICNVLEVMASSFKETFSGPVDDLHHLLECTLKAKQHMEIMIWCIRHQFLKNVQPRYPDYTSWNFHFNENKAAAVQREWPDILNCIADPSGSKPTLFIEEALSQLGIEQNDTLEEVDISCLQDGNSLLYLQSDKNERNNNNVIAYYPFKNVRAAADILFLCGASDMVVAKHAIFLYYLFDRHWTRPDVEWKHLVDDFAASFSISRQSVLESLTFYLLDDHTEEAVQEAVQLLSEIAGPETHPKIAQVLLERQHPDDALIVLRCSGHDGFSVYPKSGNESLPYISLNEAITVIRVRIECGLLTESFMYQRTHCSKVKEIESRKRCVSFSDSSKLDSWVYCVDILVTEICQLCLRRNIVDRMIELPWNSDEGKIIHKCLFDYASQHPASTSGSLLVVYYLQRYRYIEAYQVHIKLHNLEHKFSETADEEVVIKINSISHWRTGLVEKSLELLPEAVKQDAISKGTADGDSSSTQGVQMSFDSDSPNMSSNPNTLYTPSSTNASLTLQKSIKKFPSKKSQVNSPTNFASSISSAQFELGKKTQSFLQHRLLSSLGSSASRMNSANDGLSSSKPFNEDQFLQKTPIRTFEGSASKVSQNGHQFNGEYSMKLNSVGRHEENHQTYNSKNFAEGYQDLIDTSDSNGLLKEPTHSAQPKQNFSNTWSLGKRESPSEDSNKSFGLRWRSDDSSEDESELVSRHHSKSSSVNRRRQRILRR